LGGEKFTLLLGHCPEPTISSENGKKILVEEGKLRKKDAKRVAKGGQFKRGRGEKRPL